MRLGIWTCTIVTALFSPAAALADSLSITPPADPIATVEAPLSVQVTTDRTDFRLTVVTRAVSDGPCGASPFADYQQDDAGSRQYPTDERPPPNPIRSGTYEFSNTWEDVGAYRLCAWIHKQEQVTAIDSEDVNVRAPRGSMKVSRIAAAAVRQDGSYLTARFSGTIEGSANIRGTVVRASKECPADPADGRRSFSVDDPLVDGTFSRSASSTGPVPFGRWRVCAYAIHQFGKTVGATAAATAVYRHRVKPIALEKPDIGTDPNTRWLTCKRGTWAGYPKRLSFSFQWYRGGRKIAGARGRRYNARRHGYYTCAVTARNRVGSTTTRSYGWNILKV